MTTIDPPSWYQYLFYNPPLNTPRDCGKVEQHDYQLYLAINDIEHTKTKAMSSKTNSICEQFHKTILNEFYQVTFRKKLYDDLEALNRFLMNGWFTIIMSEPIREKCAVAEHRWKRYLMESTSGMRKTQARCNLTDTFINSW